MKKPTIHPTADTLPFWDGCRSHTLKYQICEDCDAVQLMPRSVCTKCHGSSLAWRNSLGQGVVLTYTIVHRASTPAFRDETPYIIALIDMNEGFRLMVNVRGSKATAIGIGTSVQIGFETRGDITVPVVDMETL